MKIILKQEVKNLGREWDQVTVADGYARNYLFPHNLAMAATQASVKDLESRRQKAMVKRTQSEISANALVEKIQAISIVIAARTGAEGRLYGSVTAGDIADYLKEHGVEVDRHKIVIADPIRTVGDHSVTIEIYSHIVAHVKVKVIPEGGVVDPVAEQAPIVDTTPAEVESADEA